MEKEENLIKVFTGPEATAMLLMQRLEETGIESLIKNDSNLGYLGAVPQLMDLYIFEEDLDKAMPLIEEMNEVQEPDDTEETEEPGE
ncbi:MAG: putative signal transducing protein [Bacteroidales bacterium]